MCVTLVTVQCSHASLRAFLGHFDRITGAQRMSQINDLDKCGDDKAYCTF